MAAAIGSSIMYTRRAPHRVAASSRARRSTPVTSLGTQSTMRGRTSREVRTWSMNHRSMRSVSSASETTPSRRGRTADGARRPAEHLLGPAAGCDEPAGADLHGHDRRLLDDDPATPDVDQGVGGAEVDREVTPQGAQPRSGGHAAIVPRSALEIGEPDADLACGGLVGVGSVHDVLLHLGAPVAAEVAADRAGCGVRRVGGAGEAAEALDAVLALDDDRGDGTGAHELDERLVEGLALVLGVVRGELLTGGRQHGEGDQPVALPLDATQHLTGEAALETVGLDEDEGTFGGHPSTLSAASPSAASPSAASPSAAAASRVATTASTWLPLTRQVTHSARKKRPTMSIIGTTRALSRVSTWTTQPSVTPHGRRMSPAA